MSTQGNSYASYLLGYVNSAGLNDASVPEDGERWKNYAVYAQDDWKLDRKLTINLGLRYEIPVPFVEGKDHSSFLNATLPNPEVNNYPGALQFAGTGQSTCNCRTLVKTHYLTLAPNVGFAYSPTSTTVLRGSYGIIDFNSGALGGGTSDPGQLGYTASPSFTSPNAGITAAFNWNNGVPAYTPPPFIQSTLNTGYNTTTGATGGSVTYTEPNTAGRSAYTENWNLTIQQQLTPATALSISYSGSASHFLELSGGYGIYSDQLNPKYLVLGSLLNAAESPTTLAQAQAILPGIALPYANFQGSIGQMLRPFPQYSAVSDGVAGYGNGHYSSLQVLLQRTLKNGLFVHAAYTWGKEIDDAGGEDALVADAAAERSAYNPQMQRSVSTDPHHVLAIAASYAIPFGRGHAFGSGALLNQLIGGWKISGIASYSSGPNLGSFSATCTLPNAGTCYADYNPNFSGNPRIDGKYGSGNPKGSPATPYLNIAAFQQPASYTYGTTPRTAAYGLEGPGSEDDDVSIQKTFDTWAHTKLKLQADAFNVFNRVVFASPSLNIASSAFGTVASQSNSPRQLQFEAHLTF